MAKCKQCGKVIDWQEVLKELVCLFVLVDFYGSTILSEEEQSLFNGRICLSCFRETQEQNNSNEIKAHIIMTYCIEDGVSPF